MRALHWSFFYSAGHTRVYILHFTRGDGGGVDMKKGLGERKMKIFAHKKVIIVLGRYGTYFLFHM